MAKKHFEEIDEAYKIIGSPLRRFIFKEFGLQALKIMEELPNVMNEFEGNLSPEMEQVLFLN